MTDQENSCPYSNSYHPFEPKHLSNPFPLWQEFQEHAPIFFVEETGFWAVTSADLIENIIRDTDTFTSRYSLNFPEVPENLKELLPWGYPQNHPSLINTDPPEHTRIRRLAGKPLTAPEVKKMEQIIVDIGNTLIDSFIEEGHCDLVSVFTIPFPVVVISTILGVPPEDRMHFKRWTDYAFLLSTLNLTGEQLQEITVGHAELKDYLVKMLNDRRKKPQFDLLSKLINAREEELPALDDKQIISVVAQLLIGGNGTTTDLIGSMMSILLGQESLWEGVKDDQDSCAKVVEETLRIKPSIRGLFRTTTKECTLGGVSLPEGATIWVVFGASGHDKSVFSNAEQFDLERKNINKHMSFGRGNHMCIGASLARLEAQIALKLLSERIPSMRLRSNQKLEYPPSLVSHGPSHLQVEWDVE